MAYERVRGMIDEAFRHEARTGTCAEAVRTFAQMKGRRLGEKDVAGVVAFIKEYVGHAPAILEQAGKAAAAAGLSAQVAPILQAAEQYFLHPLDVIPDRLGLVGLMDDAYLTHALLQGVSDGYREVAGKPLLEADMTQANLLIRALIGEPAASLLDGGVVSVLQGTRLRQSIQALGRVGGQVSFNVPDPVYGNMSVEEIANHRMGMLGII